MCCESAASPVNGEAATVVVAAYGNPRNVCLLLEALARQSLQPDEVIIADDGSTPELLDTVKRTCKPPFRLLHVWQPDNGFRAARSRNNGIHHARNMFLVFLDHDVLPHRGWLAAHRQCGGPSRVCLGRVYVIGPDESGRLDAEAVRSGAFESWHDPASREKVGRQQVKYTGYALMRRFGLPFKKTRPSLSSGNFSACKQDLQRVNGFDEAYEGWGQEDDDLGRRLYMAGVRPVPILTRALASHIHHPVEHAGWKEGPNLKRYRRQPQSPRCEQGLASHPYDDVRLTVVRE